MKKRVYVLLSGSDVYGVYPSVAAAESAARQLERDDSLTQGWVVDSTYFYGEPSNELA